MAKTYFFLQGTAVVGPLQQAELESLIQKKVVKSATMISADGNTWQKACELLPAFFGQPEAPSYSTSGAEQWHVQTPDGQNFGPVSFTELLSWVTAGNVTEGCLVRASSQNSWRRAGEVFPQLNRSVATARSTPSPQPTSQSIAIQTARPSSRSTGSKGFRPKSATGSDGGTVGMSLFVASAAFGFLAYALVNFGFTRPTFLIAFVTIGVIIRALTAAAKGKY